MSTYIYISPIEGLAYREAGVLWVSVSSAFSFVSLQAERFLGLGVCYGLYASGNGCAKAYILCLNVHVGNLNFALCTCIWCMERTMRLCLMGGCFVFAPGDWTCFVVAPGLGVWCGNFSIHCASNGAIVWFHDNQSWLAICYLEHFCWLLLHPEMRFSSEML